MNQFPRSCHNLQRNRFPFNGIKQKNPLNYIWRDKFQFIFVFNIEKEIGILCILKNKEKYKKLIQTALNMDICRSFTMI